VGSNGFGSGEQRAVIGPVMAAHWRWHADDDDVRITEELGIRGEVGIDVLEIIKFDLTGKIQAGAKLGDFLGVNVKAD
jgi:hypothetical protein